MSWKHWLLIITLLLILLGAGGAAAQEVRQGDICAIETDEVIERNLFVLCRLLTINGRVEGNLSGAASIIEINGSVGGDIYLLGGQLRFNGAAGENLHFLGPVLQIGPQARFERAASDLVSLSLSTSLSAGADIPGSVTYAGYELNLDGRVGGEVNFWGAALKVGGAVEGDVNANVGDPNNATLAGWLNLLFPLFWDSAVQNPGLIVSSGAQIAGDLRYVGPVEGVIEGTVAGEVVFSPVSLQPDLSQIIPEEQPSGRELGLYLSQVFQEVLTLAVVGLIALAAAFRPMQTTARQLRAHPLLGLGTGLLFLVVGVLAILALVLVGGLVLVILARLQLNGLTWAGGLALAVAALGGSGAFAFVVAFLSRVIAALAVGRLLVEVAVGDDGSPRISYIGLIVGIVALALLVSLPLVGWVVHLAAILWGLGALPLAVQHRLRRVYGRPPALPFWLSAPDGQPEPPPPPILDDTRQLPGMDNLPPGFKWWPD
jgi:cytoskeletal protein CcmA (bactofilin family)